MSQADERQRPRDIGSDDTMPARPVSRSAAVQHDHVRRLRALEEDLRGANGTPGVLTTIALVQQDVAVIRRDLQATRAALRESADDQRTITLVLAAGVFLNAAGTVAVLAKLSGLW